jgi:hypothetical protein
MRQYFKCIVAAFSAVPLFRGGGKIFRQRKGIENDQEMAITMETPRQAFPVGKTGFHRRSVAYIPNPRPGVALALSTTIDLRYEALGCSPSTPRRICRSKCCDLGKAVFVFRAVSVVTIARSSFLTRWSWIPNISQWLPSYKFTTFSLSQHISLFTFVLLSTLTPCLSLSSPLSCA